MTYNGLMWMGNLRVDQEPSDYETLSVETIEMIDDVEHLIRMV